MKGIKLMPMYAGFRPDDERLSDLWHYAQTNRLPVLLHTGTTFISQAPLEYTLPRHLDPVAIRYPEVRMILAHLGHPFEGMWAGHRRFLGDELPSEISPNEILLKRALANLKDGDILMAHLGIWSRKDPFAPMLDPLIGSLKSKGFCFATIPTQ